MKAGILILVVLAVLIGLIVWINQKEKRAKLQETEDEKYQDLFEPINEEWEPVMNYPF